MNLETCDGFWLACGSNGVNSLTNLDGDFHILEVLVEGDQHAWVHREDQIVEEIVVVTTDEQVHVCGSVQHGKDTGEADIREEEFVGVHWGEAEHSFSKMDQTLGDSHNEENVSGGAIVSSQVSQTSSHSRVVGAGADETKSEDRALGNTLIGIVRKFDKHVHGLYFWVRDPEQADCKWHSSLDDWLTVLEEVVHCTKGHLLSDILAEGNEGDSEDGGDLMD